MKKLLLVFLLIMMVPSMVWGVSLPETYSDKVLIYDLTEDKVLLEKKSDERSNIASLTKIMTTITAIEKNSNLKEKITITEEMLAGIPWDASIAGLKKEEVYTLEDLLYASILPSGADATQAIAVHTSGSVKAFVQDMNDLAKKIGVEDTNFVNVTGYDVENHYSNIQDVLKILKHALENNTFKKIFCTKQKTLENGKVVNSTLITYNRLMGLDTSRILGSKTGFTAKAGVCIAALIKSNDHDLLLITLGAPYVYGNFYNLRDALALTDFMDKNFDNLKVVKQGDVVLTLPVELSKVDSYEIRATKDVFKYLPVDYEKDKFEAVYEGKENLSFKDIKGNTLGEVSYYYDGEFLAKEKVSLETDIDADVLKVAKYYGVPLCIGLGIFIAFLIVAGVIKKFIRKQKRKKRKKV